MNPVSKFYIKDVRCFDGEHEFNIRPLTFLVGENSTGKSTMLGCLQAFSNFLRPGYPYINFNSGPYQMGTFADIVRRSRPLKTEFQLGIDFGREGKKEDGQAKFFLCLTEKEKGTEPVVCKVRWPSEKGEIVFSRREDNTKSDFTIKRGRRKNEFHISVNRFSFRWHWFDLGGLRTALNRISDTLNEVEEECLRLIDSHNHKAEDDFFSRELTGSFGRYRNNMVSIAPVRSKPKRTYEPLTETETPEGSEIPIALMNLSVSDKKKWETLKQKLLEFGKASGLFADIVTRRLGRSRSDPFQLQIKVGGHKTNLVDVGYGVSQILPILVRIMLRKKTGFLLQQPEVHLHPRGQAELTSLLAEMTRGQEWQNSFVIETHSDYMIDRARIEIMKGRIKPEDVSLIYFEPDGNRVKTHNIGFDSQANMIGVPQGYRDFFLRESDKFLGLFEE